MRFWAMGIGTTTTMTARRSPRKRNRSPLTTTTRTKRMTTKMNRKETIVKKNKSMSIIDENVRIKKKELKNRVILLRLIFNDIIIFIPCGCRKFWSFVFVSISHVRARKIGWKGRRSKEGQFQPNFRVKCHAFATSCEGARELFELLRHLRESLQIAIN